MKLSPKLGTLFKRHDPHTALSTDKPVVDEVIRLIGMHRDPDTHRPTTVALIRCDVVATPKIAPFEWLEERIARGEFIQIDESLNPAAPGIRCVEDLKHEERIAAFKKVVAERSALIAPAIALGWLAFDCHERNEVLRQVAAGSVDRERHSLRWLNELLWRHWTGGALALGPQYYRCGAYSRPELAVLLRNEKPAVIGRRSGRTVTLSTADAAARKTDRGGSYINPFAEIVISSLISDYFKDDQRKKEIEISLQRRRQRLPWTAITKYVNGRLLGMPDYRNIEASVAQIRLIGLRNVNVLEVLTRVLGKRYTDLNHRSIRGDYRDVAFYAGHRYEIDAVRADIHLVDDVTRMPIGRVNIILVVDTYSGLIVGVYFTVEDITFAHAARALHCAFTPKPEWCRSTIGLEIADQAWEVDGRCDHVAADNAQFLTDAAQAIPELIADTGICPAYRPDLKALVETTAELSNIGLVHLFRYGVSKGPKERAKEDPARDATVTLQTFAREFTRWVVDVANHRPLPNSRELDPDFLATGLLPTPFNVFNWSRKLHGGPPHAYDKNTWMPRLLERTQATVTPRGLEVDDIYFDLPNDESFQSMKAKATVGKTTYKPVHIDRLTAQQIYLIPDDITQPPQVIPLSEYSRNCRGLSFGEVKKQKDRRKALNKDAKTAETARKRSQQQAQSDAVQKDKEALNHQHGSIGARNHKAKGTDLEEVKDDQAKRDNAKGTTAMHGAGAAPSNNSEASDSGDSNAGKSAKRPKLFN